MARAWMAVEVVRFAREIADNLEAALRARPQILLAIGAAAALLLCRFPVRSRGGHR